MNANEVARRLFSHAMMFGGVTLDARDYVTVPISGYVVGGVSRPRFISAYEARYASLTALHGIEDWLYTRPGTFGNMPTTGYIGSWRDDNGNIHVDQCEILADRDAAIALGRERGEIAIFNLDSGEEITI